MGMKTSSSACVCLAHTSCTRHSNIHKSGGWVSREIRQCPPEWAWRLTRLLYLFSSPSQIRHLFAVVCLAEGWRCHHFCVFATVWTIRRGPLTEKFVSSTVDHWIYGEGSSTITMSTPSVCGSIRGAMLLQHYHDFSFDLEGLLMIMSIRLMVLFALDVNYENGGRKWY